MSVLESLGSLVQQPWWNYVKGFIAIRVILIDYLPNDDEILIHRFYEGRQKTFHLRSRLLDSCACTYPVRTLDVEGLFQAQE